MRIAFLVLVLVALAVAAFIVFQNRGGYRGVVGFRNRSGSEIASVRLTGFARPIECRTLAPGEHSFNDVGTVALPAEVVLDWILAGETVGRRARVSLAGIPESTRDGEIFFVLSSDGSWTVEHTPHLRLEELQGRPD